MEIYGRPIENERTAQDIYSWTKDQHGTAGPEFVRQLVTRLDEAKEDYSLIKDYLENKHAGKSMSHLSAVSTVLLADMYSSMWVFGLDEDTAFNEMKELGDVIVGKLEDSKNIDDGTRAFEYFWGWLYENIIHFNGKHDNQWGVLKPDKVNINLICVLPQVFERTMKDAGYNPQRILRDWAENELIETETRGGKVHYKKRIWDSDLKKSVYMICIKNSGETNQESNGNLTGWEDIGKLVT
jgi:hypothetical protein